MKIHFLLMKDKRCICTCNFIESFTTKSRDRVKFRFTTVYVTNANGFQGIFSGSYRTDEWAHPHVPGESGIPIRHFIESALQSGNFWIRYESGIAWMLNQDIFLSGDVTRSSPVLYREYCIQDCNLDECSFANIPRGVLTFFVYLVDSDSYRFVVGIAAVD